MSVALEQAIVLAHATVMIYDDVNKRWVPAGASNGLAKVQIYHHTVNSTYRVVGRKTVDHEVVINCPVVKGLKYNQATPTFHQWRDNRQVYGLNFASKEDAEAFSTAMSHAVDQLNNPPSALAVTRYSTQASLSGPSSVVSSTNSSASYGPALSNHASNGHHNHSDSNGDDHDIYSRGSYAQNALNNGDHYATVAAAVQKEPVRSEWHANVNNYLSSANSMGSSSSINSSTAAPAQRSLAPVSLQPSTGLVLQQDSHRQISVSAAAITPAAAAPPAPPPPPPLPVNASGNGINSLANALQNATLRKTSLKDNGSIGSVGSNSSQTSQSHGSHGLISEMQATLARRRAKQDRAGTEDVAFGESAGSPLKVIPTGTSEKKIWEKDRDNIRSASTSKLTINGNGAVNGMNGPESPKLPRKGVSFSGGMDQELSKGATTEVDAISTELERFKQEILFEVRREMNKMKVDLIEAIRQELAGRR